MALRVVHQLEVVQVHREQRRAAADAPGALERLLHPLDEQIPVRQAGERVVGRLAIERVPGTLQVHDLDRPRRAHAGDGGLLGALHAQVGERQAGELVTVDAQGRRSDQHGDRPAPPVDQLQLQ